MQVKTITTAAGVNEIDFGNDSSRSTAHFYWLKNLGDSTLYVSANPDPIAEGDDVAELPAKGATSVETDEGKVYVLGTGKVEIHRTDSKFCPFDWQASGSTDRGVNYSTDEQLIGTWIDGSPLYQKTIVINVDKSKTWVRVSLGDGLYNVISNDTIIRFVDGSCNIPAPTYRFSGEFASILFTPTTVEAYTENDVYFGTWYATIRYTKG